MRPSFDPTQIPPLAAAGVDSTLSPVLSFRTCSVVTYSGGATIAGFAQGSATHERSAAAVYIASITALR